MSRAARVVVPDVAHHVTSRGIRGEDVFRDDDDRVLFTNLMVDSCNRYGVRVRAYTWMTNHDHLIAVPSHPDSFARAFRRANSIYARRFNEKYKLRGYLWQDRFYSCPLDERHYWSAMRYVELNPVRAGMVRRAEDYVWSSAAAHCRGEYDRLLDPDWKADQCISNWSDWLNIPDDEAVAKRIRHNTRSGHPCGDEAFVRQMEQLLGRVLRTQKRGPKPRLQEESRDQLVLRGIA